jgi:hypothetical protein
MAVGRTSKEPTFRFFSIEQFVCDIASMDTFRTAYRSIKPSRYASFEVINGQLDSANQFALSCQVVLSNTTLEPLPWILVEHVMTLQGFPRHIKASSHMSCKSCAQVFSASSSLIEIAMPISPRATKDDTSFLSGAFHMSMKGRSEATNEVGKPEGEGAVSLTSSHSVTHAMSSAVPRSKISRVVPLRYLALFSPVNIRLLSGPQECVDKVASP